MFIRVSIVLKSLFFALALVVIPLVSQDVVFDLKGHLSQDSVDDVKSKIDKSPQDISRIVINIQSQSGELVPTLDLAKYLFEVKSKQKATVHIFIDDDAIGPAAILPFLADELYTTPVLSWGAIISREGGLPLNVLRSRLYGIIDPHSSKYALLKLIADAMIDPDVGIEDVNGLKHVEAEKISTKKGETLVLNHFQLEGLGLIKETLSYKEFSQRFMLPAPKVEAPKETIKSSEFEEKLSKYIHLNEKGNNKIGHIIIDDRQSGINQSTWIYVNSALNYYKKNKPICIILELNTPGGEVFAAQRISDALKEMDTQYGVPVIAFINNWAISAGAMLAYSCRYIVIVKDASMGAAEPVTFSQTGEMQSVPEKISSALRTDFANRAKFYDRNPNIAEAMVDKDVILVMRHGEIIKLESEDQIRKGGIDADIIICPKGKLLTLNATQLIEYGVADKMIPPTKIELPSEEELSKGIYPVKKSPFGLISFFAKIPNCFIEDYRMDWQTNFLAILSHPVISSLLFMGMLIGFYIEMSTPGMGVAGVMGMLCLFFIILSSFALEAIHWLEPILLVFGLFLLGLELFFFPTLGILGVFGAIFMIVGLVGMMIPGIGSINFEGDTLNAAGEYVVTRLVWLSGSFLVAIVIMAFLSRYMAPRLHLMKRLVLGDTQMLATGEHEMKVIPPTPITSIKVGDIAEVFATLRPAGKVIFLGEEIDVISSGGFIDKGKHVRILSIEGEKITVEEIYKT